MKTKIKKSLSLMLAVLMVLSCWVWVAPEKKAAAADYKDGYYYIKLTTNVTDTGNEDGSTITITYKTNNGTGETKEYVKTYGQMSWSGQSTVFAEYIPGYPTAVHWNMPMGWGRSENHRDITLWVGKDANNCTTKALYSEGYNFKDDKTGLVGSTNEDCYLSVPQGLETPRPNPEQSFFYDNNGNTFTADTLVTIPAAGDSTVISKDFNFQLCDQYGVYWYNTPNFNLSKTEGGTTDMADEESGFWWVDKGTSGKSVTVKITEQMQKSLSLPLSNTDGYIDYYIVGSLTENDGTVALSRKIRVTYPKYDWNFDTTVQGSAYTADKIIMSDGSFYDANNDSQPDAQFEKNDYLAYNQKASEYPVSAEKKGFTFLGFWTKPQSPVAGDPSEPFAPTATFKYPISQNEYDGLTDEEKEGYVVAGEKWDPKADSSQLNTEGDKKYYAWWLADDINVKFYDVDGKFLAEKTVKAGQGNGAFVWPTPTQQYVSGSFTYSNWNKKWQHTDGTEVDSTNHTFWSDLILTPVYEKVDFTNKYYVTFYNTYGATGMYGFSGQYGYRALPSVPATSDITALNETDAYTYEFVGFVNWAPESGNYHVMLEDYDFDANGHALNIIEDFTVRSDVSYYPVFRQHIKSYDIYFEYINEQADYVGVYKTFKYGETITAPEGIPAVYAEGGYEYKFLGWTRGGNDVTLSQEVCRPDYEYYAKYDQGTPTPYTITFVYKNEKGEDVTAVTEVNHGDYITESFVESLMEKPYGKYDDGTQELYFNLEEGKWNFNGKDYTYDDLLDFGPTGHTTFTAVYENGKPFHTVTYKDGAKTQSFRLIDGSALPAWTYEVGDETETYLPSIADTEDGRYTFLGWFDEEQIDIGATNGNQYVVGETEIKGDVTLYPQFSFGRFKYYIEFYNYDGTLLERGTYYYKDSYEGIIRDAEAKAIKPADNTYTYQFLGWDKKVPEFCEGGEPESTISFIAQYKPIYIYYNVEWYNDLASMEDASVDPIKVSKYVYGDRMFTPSVTLTPPTGAPEGQSYVFAGWKYKDAEGNIKDFDRNLRVNGNMKFFADYTLTDKMWTVTVNDGKNAVYTVSVKDKAVIGDLISDPIAGYVDAQKHNAFAGWYTAADFAADKAFDIEATPVTSDITLYAKFTESNHVYTKKEIVENPSYPMAELKNTAGDVLVAADDGKGTMAVWCECDKAKTKVEKDIPSLADAVTPTGTAYIGTQWTTGDSYDKVVYANAKTDLIFTTTDKGNVLYTKLENGEIVAITAEEAQALTDAGNGALVDTFNAAAKGNGVDTIWAAIYPAADVVTEDNIVFTDGKFDPELSKAVWTQVYSWSTIQSSLIQYYGSWAKVPDAYKDYNANIADKPGNYPLTDGTEYIVYGVITDKSGNHSFMRTCTFLYDTTAPVVAFAGKSNTTNDKFCKDVTITVTEDNLKSVTANGVALTANDEGKYVIDAAGYYNIVVEDKAGNKVNAYIEVFADHDYEDFKVDPTCLADGHTSSKCTVCGDETDIVEIPTTGHDKVVKNTPATCTANGYDTVTCSKCDFKEIVDVKVRENGLPELDDNGDVVYLYPAKGHNYGEGTVTLKPTCTNVGERYFVCANGCGSTKRETIAIDADAHYFRPAEVVLAPTCTETGIEASKCRYCNQLLNQTEIPALGHSFDKANDAHYVVVTAPTCVATGSAKLVCQVCGADIYEEDTLVTKTLAATGVHTYALYEEVAPSYDADGKPVDGKRVYRCTVCNDSKYDIVKTIEATARYTVKIYDAEAPAADAVPVYSEVLYKGDIINANLATPTKASDNEYNYTFDGWFTKKADGSWGSEIDVVSGVVSSDLTIYAKFKATKRFYTVQFKSYKGYDAAEKKYTGEYEYKSLMGAIGDEVAPGFQPTMADTALNSYEFKGWTNAKGEAVDKIVVTASGDATYYAKFEVTAKKVTVTFANYDNSLLETKEIVSGADAVYGGAAPTKAADDKNHYTFKGWDKALTGITKDTVFVAQYTAAAHDWKVVKVSQNATCHQVELTDYACDCGKTKTEQTAPALTHVKGDPVPELDKDGKETGYYVVNCKLCGDELEKYKTTFTIKFVDEDIYTVLALINNAKPDEAPVYTGKVPTKASDKQYTYTFAGFEDEDGNKYYADKDGKVTVKKPTKDETYKAFYTSTVRKYRVTYVDSSNNVLQTTGGLDFGAAIPAYEGDVSKIAVPKFNNYVHYVFDKWSVEATATISGDMVIRPVFKEVEHTLVETGSSDPTCTEKGGKGQKCSANCGYQFTDGTVPALGHNYIVTSKQDPTDKTEGYINYKCTRCKDEYTETIPVKQPIIITVNVKDTQGRAIEGARVQLYLANAKVDEAATDANGKAVFKVYVEGEYYVVISNIEGFGGTIEGNVTIKDGDNTIDTGDELGSIDIIDCDCACHRDNFWGMLFRFFHKIIKLFAGKYICCACPSDKY